MSPLQNVHAETDAVTEKSDHVSIGAHFEEPQDPEQVLSGPAPAALEHSIRGTHCVSTAHLMALSLHSL